MAALQFVCATCALIALVWAMLMPDEMVSLWGWLSKERDVPLWEWLDSALGITDIISFGALFAIGAVLVTKDIHRFYEARIFFGLSCLVVAVRLAAVTCSRVRGRWKWLIILVILLLGIWGEKYLLGIADGAQQDYEADMNEKDRARVKEAMAKYPLPPIKAPEAPQFPLVITGYKLRPVVIGQPATVEVHYKSVSQTTTLHLDPTGTIGIATCTNDKAEIARIGDKTFASAKQYARDHHGRASDVLEVPPLSEMHIDIATRSATENEILGLLPTPAKACVYFAGFFDYQFQGKHYETPFCGFSDEQHGLPNCPTHNEPSVVAQSSPDNPIDVVAFDSLNNLTVKNSSGYSMYVIDMQTAQEMATSYIALGFEVPPHRTVPFPLRLRGDIKLGSIQQTGNTWRDHYEAAAKKYGLECLVTAYFATDDAGLLTMVEHYRKDGNRLGMGEATGVIHYSLSDSSAPRSHTIKLAVTAMHNLSCAPR